MNSKAIWAAMLAGVAGLALTACEREGPAERAGEEIDEAVDTMGRGGEESAETRADDTMDEMRDAAEEARGD
jgi:hypothetical protein